MTHSEFLGLFGQGRGEGPDRAGAIAAVREQLEDADYEYVDVSGDGTRYERYCLRQGAGFATGVVEVQEDGRAVVAVEGGPRVAPEHEAALRKLCRHFSRNFKVPALVLEDGCLNFRTRPFDPRESRYDVDQTLSLGLSSVHAFAGLTLALDAGVEGFELLAYDEDGGRFGGPDDDDDDDDDGMPMDLDEPMTSTDGLAARLAALLGGD